MWGFKICFGWGFFVCFKIKLLPQWWQEIRRTMFVFRILNLLKLQLFSLLTGSKSSVNCNTARAELVNEWFKTSFCPRRSLLHVLLEMEQNGMEFILIFII